MKFRGPVDALGLIIASVAFGLIMGHLLTIVSLMIPVGQ